MPRVEESITLSDEVLEVTAYLQHCWELLDSGREDEITSDPFWEWPDGKNPSDEKVRSIINSLEARYAIEIDRYPSYHLARSGANALPGFDRLSDRAARCMIETIKQIFFRSGTQTGPSSSTVYYAPAYSSGNYENAPNSYEWC